MVEDFAVIQARKYGLRVFFSNQTGDCALAMFDGWEYVAMPDGSVLDAIPLKEGKINRISCGLQLVEAFA